MKAVSKKVVKYYSPPARKHSVRRLLRLSPDERRLMQLMGARLLTLPRRTSTKTERPLTFVISFGRILMHEHVRHNVIVGAYRLSFGNDIRRGIRLDGQQYFNDIVVQQEQDDYYYERGWSVIHIDPQDIVRRPAELHARVAHFLTH